MEARIYSTGCKTRRCAAGEPAALQPLRCPSHWQRCEEVVVGVNHEELETTQKDNAEGSLIQFEAVQE